MSAFGGTRLKFEKYARMTHQMTIQSRPSTLGSLAHLTAKALLSSNSGSEGGFLTKVYGTLQAKNTAPISVMSSECDQNTAVVTVFFPTYGTLQGRFYRRRAQAETRIL